MADSPIPDQPLASAIQKSDRRGDILAYGALALLALVVILVFIAVMAKVTVDGSTGSLVVQVITAVISVAGIVYGFQFGSSKGSQDKNATIAQMTPTADAPVAQPPQILQPANQAQSQQGV